MHKHIKIYTDGACKGNPGPGGWGALLIYEGKEKEISGAEMNTTNNRMELMAAIQALTALKQTCVVELFTDSQYLKQGMTEWLSGWKRKGWKTASRQPVKNVALWQQLDALAITHHVVWHWVKAHAGHIENERADALANRAIEALLAKEQA